MLCVRMSLSSHKYTGRKGRDRLKHLGLAPHLLHAEVHSDKIWAGGDRMGMGRKRDRADKKNRLTQVADFYSRHG